MAKYALYPVALSHCDFLSFKNAYHGPYRDVDNIVLITIDDIYVASKWHSFTLSMISNIEQYCDLITFIKAIK